MTRSCRARRADKGQALVESALILPLFLVLMMGVFDVGRAIWATTSLASAAREAARFAIVHGGTFSTPCPVGTPSADANIPLPGPSCPFPSPSKQAIVNAATTAAIAGGSNVTVTVCYGAGCSGNTDTTNNARGQPITVVVSSTVNLVVPSLLGRTGFNLSGSSTMVVNH
jgi:hypothetical protein